MTNNRLHSQTIHLKNDTFQLLKNTFWSTSGENKILVKVRNLKFENLIFHSKKLKVWRWNQYAQKNNFIGKVLNQIKNKFSIQYITVHQLLVKWTRFVKYAAEKKV